MTPVYSPILGRFYLPGPARPWPGRSAPRCGPSDLTWRYLVVGADLSGLAAAKRRLERILR